MTHTFLTPRSHTILLSTVMPFYNEEAVLHLLRPTLTAFLDQLPYPCEIITVNDGRSDRTIDLLVDWCRSDPQLKVLTSLGISVISAPPRRGSATIPAVRTC